MPIKMFVCSAQQQCQNVPKQECQVVYDTVCANLRLVLNWIIFQPLTLHLLRGGGMPLYQLIDFVLNHT